MFDDTRKNSKTQRDPKWLNFLLFLYQKLSKFPLWEIVVEVTKMIMRNIPQKSSKEFPILLMSASKRKFLTWKVLGLLNEILRNLFFM